VRPRRKPSAAEPEGDRPCPAATYGKADIREAVVIWIAATKSWHPPPVISRNEPKKDGAPAGWHGLILWKQLGKSG